MKALIWFSLFMISLVSYVFADPILVQTGDFAATITSGQSTSVGGDILHWVKVADLELSSGGNMLKINTQTADGFEETGWVVPCDIPNGHTIYFSDKHIKFKVEVFHNDEVLFSTGYLNF